MAGRLAGKVALVTGAGSGIGKSVCELFAREGASVIGAGLNNVCDTITQLGSHNNGTQKHLHVEMDVAKETQVADMMKTVTQHFNQPPSIAVNCAGITRDGFLVKMKEEDFDKVIDVNLKGTFFVTKHLCQYLLKHKTNPASIINIASIVDVISSANEITRICGIPLEKVNVKIQTGNMGQANYTASKAGVVALSKTTALEFARYGIRCNAILPGFITTAMTAQVPEQVQEGVRSMIPLAQFGEPIDIANTCLFLASDESRYITAASIEVTGLF